MPSLLCLCYYVYCLKFTIITAIDIVHYILCLLFVKAAWVVISSPVQTSWLQRYLSHIAVIIIA